MSSKHRHLPKSKEDFFYQAVHIQGWNNKDKLCDITQKCKKQSANH